MLNNRLFVPGALRHKHMQAKRADPKNSPSRLDVSMFSSTLISSYCLCIPSAFMHAFSFAKSIFVKRKKRSEKEKVGEGRKIAEGKGQRTTRAGRQGPENHQGGKGKKLIFFPQASPMLLHFG